jgi:flagellar protein FliS
MATENSSVSAKAVRSYREEHISGLSQKELILMLYDGAIRFASEAKAAMNAKDFTEAHRLITRTRGIILELLRILDMDTGGEVAKNLQRLYVYMITSLIEAPLTNKLSLLDNVVAILQNLRSAWAEIDFDEALLQKNDPLNEKAPARLNNSPLHMAQSARLLSITA